MRDGMRRHFGLRSLATDMKYLLRETDYLLINGAIALGDRLKLMPEAAHDDVKNIERFQAVLRRLPEGSPDVTASYGFSVMKLDLDFVGVNRSWFVDLSPDGRVEMASFYTIVPDRDEQLERSKEFSFVFTYREALPYSPKYYREWMEEVRDPDRWRNPQQDFEIDTVFRIRDGAESIKDVTGFSAQRPRGAGPDDSAGSALVN